MNCLVKPTREIMNGSLVICKDRLSQYINNSCYIFHVNDVKWNLMHSLQILKKSHWFTRLGWLKLSNIPQPGPTLSPDWRGEGECMKWSNHGQTGVSSPTQSEAASSDICRGQRWARSQFSSFQPSSSRQSGDQPVFLAGLDMSSSSWDFSCWTQLCKKPLSTVDLWQNSQFVKMLNCKGEQKN